MAISAVLDGPPEATSNFKVTVSSNVQFVVTAPAQSSREDVLAFVKKSVPHVIAYCHDNPQYCLHPIPLVMPLGTVHPRTLFYLASAVAYPAIALGLGFVLAWVVSRFVSEAGGFRNTLIASTVLAVLAVIIELGWILTVRDQAWEWFWYLPAKLAVACGLLCVVLFVVGLFRFRLKGLWLALPVVAAWALPVSIFIMLENAPI
jgi:hypothetical protein